MAFPETVFFMSDYGLRDEFVGIVHATIHRLAPRATVIDLTHGLRPFDVRAAGSMLSRIFPHLGRGVVLAVVDPGVGGDRRGVVVQLPEGSGPRWLVGPDNGLLMAAADAAGPVELAVELPRPGGIPRDRDGTVATGRGWPGPVSFDGRDVFAPAAAALCGGAPAEGLGPPTAPASLRRLPAMADRRAVLPDGRHRVRAEVAWVDRFGNVKTSIVVDPALTELLRIGSSVELTSGGVARGTVAVGLRTVRTFADLDEGEPGVMADADGHLAVVVREGSAARMLGLGTGDAVELSW